MRRVPIHLKLAVALGGPLVALVGVVGLQLAHNTQEADEVRTQVALVKAATGPGGLFNAVQDERNRAGIDVIGQSGLIELACDDNQSCRAETDLALRQFRSQIDRQGSAARAAWAPAFEKLDGLDQLRQDVDARQPPYDIERHQDFASDMFGRYTEMIDSMLEANAQVAVQIDNPELRRGADLSYLASRETDLIARMVRQLLEIYANGAGPNGAHLDQPEEWVTVGGLWELIYDDHFALLDQATGMYADAGDKLEVESHATGITDLMTTRVLATGEIPLDDVLGAVSVGRDESYYGFRNDVKDLVEGKADGLVADAEQRVRLFTLLALGTIVVGVVAMLLVSLSITRPLRRLTRQATDMARHKLPDAVLDILDTPLGEDVAIPHVDPIKVDTRDEVADVAQALSTVQDSALDLAVEQAVLRRNIADSFVNLGRRNQNLLGRQLDFITELEQNETNSDVLANLFRLDHLATRMRRNAESLLVLAGVAPPRTWAAPVRITDVIRAALGEVEDYQRVVVRAVEPVTMLGAAAADLAHLSAELLENALTFSPPDQTVEIRGRTVHSGGRADGYTLAIVDSGLGMPPDELARANRRLAGAESFTIAPSKYLGHYVAGNLAARHGIDVQLQGSAGAGVTATITLPPHLLTVEEAATGPAPAMAVPPRVLLAAGTGTATELDGADGTSEPDDAGRTVGDLGPPFPTPPAPPADPAEDAPTTDPTDPADPDRTAGGLAKRQRRLVSVEAGRLGPPVLPDGDVLRALSQYTTQLGDPPGAIPPPPADPSPASRHTPIPPTSGHPLSPATGTPALGHLPPSPVTGQTASGLTRRVRGSQLPNTAPVTRRPSAPFSANRPGPTHAAQDVYRFLRDFSAGVERGRDESASPSPDPDDQGGDTSP